MDQFTIQQAKAAARAVVGTVDAHSLGMSADVTLTDLKASGALAILRSWSDWEKDEAAKARAEETRQRHAAEAKA